MATHDTKHTKDAPDSLPAIHISTDRFKWRLIGTYAPIMLMGIVAEFLSKTLPLPPLHSFRDILGFFQLGLEQSLPTWYSAVLFFTCAGVLATVAFDHRAKEKKHYRYWALLAFVFLFLGLDELFCIHEQSGRLLKSDAAKHSSLHGHEWVYIYGVAVPIVGLVFVPFLRGLSAWFRNRVIVAGALFVFAAWGLEIVSAFYRSHFGADWFDWSIWITEEVLEVGAILYFLVILLRYCLRNDVGLGLTFDQ